MAGLGENLPLTAVGVFIIGAGFVFAIGLNRVSRQVEAAPDVLGRLFSLRVMIGVLAQSLGVVITGPLAEQVFGPMTAPGSALAGSVGRFIGVGV